MNSLFESQTPIFLNPLSTPGEVANLALPFAQFLNPPICSAINLESGTNSVSTRAISRSVGSFSRIERQVKGLDKHVFNFATRQAFCRFGQLNQVEVLGISTMFPNLNFPDGFAFSLIGQVHKKQLIKPTLPQHFRGKLGYVIGCGDDEYRRRFFSCIQLKNEPNTLAEVPPSVALELLVPLNPFSTSSIHRQQGAMASAV